MTWREKEGARQKEKRLKKERKKERGRKEQNERKRETERGAERKEQNEREREKHFALFLPCHQVGEALSFLLNERRHQLEKF